jgi:hypothetical protein
MNPGEKLLQRVAATEAAKHKISKDVNIAVTRFAGFLGCDPADLKHGDIKFEVSSERVSGTFDIHLRLQSTSNQGEFACVSFPNFTAEVSSYSPGIVKVSNRSYPGGTVKLAGDLDSLFRECYNDVMQNYFAVE